MHRGHYMGGERRSHKLSSITRYAELLSEQSLRGSRAKTDQHGRLNGGEFRIQPWPARVDLRGAGFLVNAPFSTRCGFPTEMLYDVCHINVLALDVCADQRFIQYPAGRADERSALNIFPIARLLANEDDFGLG